MQKSISIFAKLPSSRPRLELREIEPGDGRLPETDEYQLIVDASEAVLINDIQTLTKEIASRKAGILRAGGLKVCIFETHLYEPALQVVEGSKVRIAPVSINESEFQFLDDLREYINTEGQASPGWC